MGEQFLKTRKDLIFHGGGVKTSKKPAKNPTTVRKPAKDLNPFFQKRANFQLMSQILQINKGPVFNFWYNFEGEIVGITFT